LIAVNKIIKDISAMPDNELESMLSDMERILTRNREWFESKGFLDSAWQELVRNIKL
jgi:hypothetical protein